jgi:hypothetical protein
VPRNEPGISTRRRIAGLNAKLGKTLSAYAAAAGAAGIGIMALAPPSSAEVVYTATNLPVVFNGPLLPIDLNNDGVVDFNLQNFSCATEGLGKKFLAVSPAQSGNEVLQVESKRAEVFHLEDDASRAVVENGHG